MNNGDLEKIIFTEMVKQIGDLGNYILKAIITIYGASLIAILLAIVRVPGENSITSLTEAKLFPVVVIVFVALNLAIWWVTKTFIQSHAHIARKINKEPAVQDNSGGEKRQQKTTEGRFKKCLVETVFWEKQCPPAAIAVSLAGVMFLLVSLALVAVIYLCELLPFSLEVVVDNSNQDPTPDLEPVTIEDPALEVYQLDPVTTEEADP